jgi:hypothetical protein
MTRKGKYVFLLQVVKDNGYIPSTSLNFLLCVWQVKDLSIFAFKGEVVELIPLKND